MYNKKININNIKFFFKIILFFWTFIIIVLISGNIYHSKKTINNIIKTSAEESFTKDLIYRQWATLHGGVYAPVTENTPPNPYLDHIEERDITTPSGKKLTLINPAYMTRQAHEIGKSKFNTYGHITSLTPIRKENKADPWERKALQSFESGKTEFYENSPINGKLFFRYMRPLIVNEGCLACHDTDKYAIGDIIGGISVSIDTENYNRDFKNQLALIISGFIFLYLFGLFGLIYFWILLKNFFKNRIKHEHDLKKAKLEAIKSDKAKSIFIANINHEIRTPLNSIMGFTDLILKTNIDENQKAFLSNIKNSSAELLNLITAILDFSKISSGKYTISYEKIDLQYFIQQILDAITEDAKQAGISIVFTHSSHIPNYIVTDNLRLEQILINLFTNCIKSSPVDKKITFNLDFFPIDKHTGKFTFLIGNNGIELTEHQKEKIFNPFVQGSSPDFMDYNSFSMNLSIAKRILELMDSKLIIKNSKELKNIFTFTLVTEYHK